MNDFLQRLRERKLVQWALAYVAAAFALIQVLDIVGQRFGWPEPTIRFVIVALGVGFFVTLVLAWYHGERGAQRVTGAELLILAVLLAIGGTAALKLAPTSGEHNAAPKQDQQNIAANPKSIAVLPFESLSKDEDNAYFASGMQDMILTKLAGIGDLKVISRTSTEKYKSRPENLKTVAHDLGVATILEGSVQKSGREVLINVQLIDAASDNHIWAQDYPRTLENIFGVEGEVAQKVAESLHAALTKDERTALANKPTQNAEALDAYLRALDLEKVINNPPTMVRDELLKAVQIDPHFALAWSQLVWENLRAFWFGFDPTRASLDAAKVALDRAVALAPDLPQVITARAQYEYYARLDFSAALQLMQQVQKILPNDSRTWLATAIAERRLGRWDDAAGHLEKATSLDPQDGLPRYEQLLTDLMRRRYADVLAHVEAQVDPAADSGQWEMKFGALWATGDLDGVDKVLATVNLQTPGFTGRRAMQAMFRRDYAMSSTLFARAITDAASTYTQAELFMAGYIPASPGWALRRGLAEKRLGHADAANAIFRQVAERAEKALAEKPANRYAEVAWRETLGLARAGLGERDAAIAEGKRGVELIPESVDAFEGPFWADCLAQIYAVSGDATDAVPLLEHLLHTSGSLTTIPLLKLDPIWDDIRKDAGFQKLIGEKSP